VRISPQSPLGGPCFSFQPLEGHITESIVPIPPRETGGHELVVKVLAIGEQDIAECAPVPIPAVCLHGHVPTEHQLRRELLGLRAVGLSLLRAINPIEPDLLSRAVVQDLDGITVRDPDHAPGEVGGKDGPRSDTEKHAKGHARDVAEAGSWRHGLHPRSLIVLN